MEMSQINEMVKCRENLSRFLNISDITKINKNFNGHFDANNKSFNEVCGSAIRLYKEKNISNKDCSKIISICCENNNQFKIESHRYENGKIYVFDKSEDCYVFLKNGTKKEFNAINCYLGYSE